MAYTRGHTNTLMAENSLNEGEHLVLENKAYYAVMQTDGNFVVYVSNHFRPRNRLWASNTINKLFFVRPYRLSMQGDGNLVVYDGHNRPLWSTKTGKKGFKHHRLIMQDDGNLILYDGHSNFLWNSNTPRSLKSLD